MAANGNGRVLDWVFRLATVVLIPILGVMWTTSQKQRDRIDALTERIVRIEANRFTSQDGLLVWQQLASKANKSEVPPEWFRDQVRALERKVENHISGKPEHSPSP